LHGGDVSRRDLLIFDAV